MGKFVAFTGRSDDVAAALADAGVLKPDELPTVRRVVIDLEAGEPARIYVERFADDQTLAAGIRAGLHLDTP